MRAFSPFVPLIGFVLLAGMTWLYRTDPDLYGRILTYWFYIPRPTPFGDLGAIPAWIRCFQDHGLVVYSDAASVVCGPTPIIYSPLWLRLSFLPTDPTWTNWLGLTLVSAFLLSLGLLPDARRWGERVVTLLATFSCMPVFAMERGNVDLIMFLLVGTAALCLGGPLGRRILGYGLMLLAGLLKFYPLVLLLLLLRERPRVLIALGCAAVAILAGTAFAFLDELRLLTPVPADAPFYNMWGAKNLPSGFPSVLRALLEAAGLPGPMVQMASQSRAVPVVMAALLLATTLIMTLRLAGRDDFGSGLSEIPDRAYRFLLTGATLVVGCFFAGQSIGYRGVLLLLILPGILALRHVPAQRGFGWVVSTTIAALLCVLWAFTTRHVVADIFGGSYFPVEGSLAVYLAWLVQELAWWWLIVILLAVLFRFVAGAPVWRVLRRTTR
jgi:Glycosyltransferase family 87